MPFVIAAALFVAAVVALSVLLHRRGSTGLVANTGAGRAPEEYRIPGGRGGNNDGLGA
jgi:preprotein translocase subunit SecG